MSDFLELAERCEKAEGKDRNLAWDIWDAQGKPGVDEWSNAGCAPNYTASLDAAMTLVPEEWTAWQLRSRRRKTMFIATLSRLIDDIEAEFDEQEVRGCAATPALALCAAALRARAAGAPQ